jgi:hypothetical protein
MMTAVGLAANISLAGFPELTRDARQYPGSTPLAFGAGIVPDMPGKDPGRARALWRAGILERVGRVRSYSNRSGMY